MRHLSLTLKLTRAIQANDEMAEQVESSRENAAHIIMQGCEKLHQTIEERKKQLLSEIEAISQDCIARCVALEDQIWKDIDTH